MIRRPRRSPLFPYTPLSRSRFDRPGDDRPAGGVGGHLVEQFVLTPAANDVNHLELSPEDIFDPLQRAAIGERQAVEDRKSTRLNSSHLVISYAVFCLTKQPT